MAEQGWTKITGADNIKRVDEGLVNRSTARNNN
jgi:hypothetical protein